MASRRDHIVLSYYDALITDEDVELLQGPFWLNDTIIGFYLEYLEREKYENADICFIKPEITQCLKFSDVSDFPAFLDPLNFKKKSFAVMPLNDCENPNLPGGSHWSLLVYSQPEKAFYHIDSSSGTNYQAASKLAYKLSKYINHGEFKNLPSLQQTNSYDCGVFVICNIDNVIEHALRFGKLGNICPINDYEVSRKRHDIKLLIKALARK